MKYFVAMCLLAIPIVAMSAASTPAEAGRRDAIRCHFVKKTNWFYGHKRTHWVKVELPPPLRRAVVRPPASALLSCSAGGRWRICLAAVLVNIARSDRSQRVGACLQRVAALHQPSVLLERRLARELFDLVTGYANRIADLIPWRGWSISSGLCRSRE